MDLTIYRVFQRASWYSFFSSSNQSLHSGLVPLGPIIDPIGQLGLLGSILFPCSDWSSTQQHTAMSSRRHCLRNDRLWAIVDGGPPIPCRWNTNRWSWSALNRELLLRRRSRPSSPLIMKLVSSWLVAALAAQAAGAAVSHKLDRWFYYPGACGSSETGPLAKICTLRAYEAYLLCGNHVLRLYYRWPGTNTRYSSTASDWWFLVVQFTHIGILLLI